MWHRTSVILAAVLGICVASPGDTFTEIKTGQALHGYITGKALDGNDIVQTIEKGRFEFNPARYSILRNAQGRSSKVTVLTIDGELQYECETKAFAAAVAKASSQGVAFVLVEMDTPGGRVDLAREMCAAIDSANCDVVVFVRGGKWGGAISAGAAVSLSCNKVYIARSAVFGGATVVAMGESGLTDVKNVMGDDVSTKISSIWQGMMASMAEKHGRSGLIARAMVSKEVGVVEVVRDGRNVFVEKESPGDKVVRRWNDKKRLVTLTGEEAVKSGMADGIAESREDVLRALGAADFEVTEDKSPQAAVEQFKIVKNRSDLLVRNINAKIERLQNTDQRPLGLRLIRELKTDMGQLVMLAKANPDLHIDVASMEAQYSRVEQAYRSAVRD
jgi:membrane-bound ClpP family serine protease